MNDSLNHLPEISKADWLEQVNKDLKGADFADKLIHEREGIAVEPLYTVEALPEFAEDPNTEFLEDVDPDILEAISDAGGQHLAWSMVEEFTLSAETDLNMLVAMTRNRGIADMRIRVAHDADWDHIINEIRKLSAPVNFYFDITGNLDEVMVDHWRERIGFLGERDRLVQALEFDPLKHWAQHGKPEDAGKQMHELAQACLRFSGYLQDCRLIKVDVQDIAEAQGTCVQQLVVCLQRTAAYLDAMESRNVPLHELIQLITFRFGIGTNYFFEIAKLRAFKILWQNIVQVYVPDIDFIPNPYIHGAISTNSFTTEDKHTNLLRTTTAAMSAILGGADAISLPVYDTELPMEEHGLRLAANVHNLLRYESYFDKYRDAANGSYYIESLTREMGEQAWTQFIASQKS